MRTPEQIAMEVSGLSIDERKQVINLIIDSMVDPASAIQPRKRSPLEFAGVGAHAQEQRQPQDAQEYINHLRDEWDHRP